MFPIGDDQVKGGYKPLFTYLFIVINVLVFLYQISLGNAGFEAFVNQWGTVPAQISNGQGYITLLTSMFMHGGWMHLIGNMLFLWVFGDNIEARIGNVKFVIFYLLAGLAASLAQVMIAPHSQIPGIGASGAIAGVLGAYLVMFPGARIKMLNPGYGQVFYIGAWQFLIYWIVIQSISGIGSLAATTSAEQGGVAYFAHIGGFVAGVIGGLLLKPFVKGVGQLEQSGDHLDYQDQQSNQRSPRGG